MSEESRWFRTLEINRRFGTSYEPGELRFTEHVPCDDSITRRCVIDMKMERDETGRRMCLFCGGWWWTAR